MTRIKISIKIKQASNSGWYKNAINYPPKSNNSDKTALKKHLPPSRLCPIDFCFTEQTGAYFLRSLCWYLYADWSLWRQESKKWDCPKGFGSLRSAPFEPVWPGPGAASGPRFEQGFDARFSEPQQIGTPTYPQVARLSQKAGHAPKPLFWNEWGNERYLLQGRFWISKELFELRKWPLPLPDFREDSTIHLFKTHWA